MNEREIAAQIAFSMLRGVDAEAAVEILEAVGSPEDFFGLSTAQLSSRLGSEWRGPDEAERRAMLERGNVEAAFVAKNGITMSFLTDSSYPTRLRQCPDAPLVIYSKGDNKALDAAHMVAVVGTRNATGYAAAFVRDFVADLKALLPDTVIVSGLAFGVDVMAHRAALESGMPTVGVVAHGLNTLYPAEHRDTARRMYQSGGAVVTEYRSDARIHRSNFLSRNRIIAGLCDATVVVESDIRGGSLATARLAMAYNREVLAVPGRVTDRYSQGCNNLIANNGAAMLRGADDLIECMGWTAAKPGAQREFDFTSLTGEMQRIVDHLRRNPAATINDMVASLGVPYAQLSARLMELELDGHIEAMPGGTFSVLS